MPKVRPSHIGLTRLPHVATVVGSILCASLVLASCGSDGDSATEVPQIPMAVSTASQEATDRTIEPVINDEAIATELNAPWSVAFLPDGSALVTERDKATVVRLTPQPDGTWQSDQVGQVPGVDNDGEGGLMGLAVSGDQVYMYWSTSEDNRVGVATWDGTSLSEPTVILDGIPHAGFHNGGRIALAADGTLYVSTGDAGVVELAQDPDSLAGKILRINPDGSAPEDNPTAGSLVYSLGHRNVQGLAFDAEGRLWATEFGSADVDELNVIVPAGNYGWPAHEGTAGEPGFIDPVAAWSPTSVASPSGLAIAGGSAWVAALRGQSLWQVPLDGESAGIPIPHLAGELGRLRDVVVAPDGSLWVVTNNTDGRGSPQPDDDRIVRIVVA